MDKRCKHIQNDGFHTCGSYAFNLVRDGIDQGDLCDVHYWQNKAQRQPLTDEQILSIMRSLGWTGKAPSDINFARAVEAAHGIGEKK